MLLAILNFTLKLYETSPFRDAVHASIIPLQLSAHTQATVYTVAEVCRPHGKSAPMPSILTDFFASSRYH
ncbi:hypothetical protein BD413DRAFT_613634 [Trametes elegans]|nr:hypothetical protein BD413DRAFT_613634 [Trametes elegans]